MIQVCGERVLSENRMKSKRLSDKKKKQQEVKDVKGVENYGKRNAKENEKDKSKKANI